MDNLIALINALSPTEKQHFKKRHNQKADFVLLFDYVNKKKSCITSDVLSYMSKKHSGKKSFSSSYLSVIKSYLKNRILESLRIQYIHKRKNFELLSRSMNADILLDKGLYSFAKSEIESSNENNLESSFPIERLLLLRRKSLLVYFENYRDTNLDDIESLFQSRLETAEQLLLEIKFARILSIMSFQYFNGLNDSELLKSFMTEPYMQNESLATDFATKYLFHWVHAQFEEFKDNNKGAVDHFNKSIQIWLHSPKYIDAHPRMYIGACFTYFKYLIHQKDPFSNVLSDINFDVLMSKIKTERLSIEEEEKYKVLFQLFEVLSLRKQSKWSEIIAITSPLIEDESKIENIPTYEYVVYSFYSALAQFENGNFETAEDIQFNLINPLDKRLAGNPIYTSIYLLLHILIMLEKGNEKHLRYLLPKYKNYLKQENRLTDFGIHFINMASQLISPRFKLTLDVVYKRFHKRLIESQKSDQGGIEIDYDYLVSWVKRKEQDF